MFTESIVRDRVDLCLLNLLSGQGGSMFTESIVSASELQSSLRVGLECQGQGGSMFTESIVAASELQSSLRVELEKVRDRVEEEYHRKEGIKNFNFANDHLCCLNKNDAHHIVLSNFDHPFATR